ncbi:LamG-like jellyroll fold domain-containing protein [Halalkalibacter lacteus]|uniref:LamG-like jellyroll fold domain-containing protein n=1 Tax=Halalkalibacter lacteus TaxID=3090663 RepID=UPI002FC8F72E
MGKTIRFVPTILLLCLLFSVGQGTDRINGEEKDIESVPMLERIEYNNPGLVVDLGIGAWAHPLPMDYNGNGHLDLLVSGIDKPFNGLYFFENISGDVKHPVFKEPVRISHGLDNVTISYVDGEPIVTTPGRVYPNVKETGLYPSEAIPFEGVVHVSEGFLRGNQWSFVDYNGNGVQDLIVGVGDWDDYGWDNAFDENGEWTNGPLHGYVYYIENLGTTEDPDYSDPVKIEAGGNPIDVYGKPSPVVADFNGNGKLDIITGEHLDKLTFFENIGTRTEPVYDEGKYLENNNGTITMDLQMLVVSAIDWTKNGHMDLIVGQEDGRVALVENTGEVVNGMPVFEEPYFFQQQADTLKVNLLATPDSYDWDGDGIEDLIVGDTAGRISFVKNLSGGASPTWAEPVYLEAGGEEIRIQAGENGSIQGPAEAKWGYTVVKVADWNHDGLPDIIANDIWGKVHWYENVGTRKNPVLAAAQPIEVEWEGDAPKPEWNWWDPEGKSLVTQWRTTPYVMDLNEDGLNDLIMLDHEGYLAFFERQEIDGQLKLLPGERIFIGEEGSSKFDKFGYAVMEPKGPIQMNYEEAGSSGRRKFTIVDWNGDGKLDLLVNGRPNINLLLNVGTEEEPFLFRNMGQVTEGVLAGHTTSPTIVDWNDNGVPDLLVGAEDGRMYYLENNYSENQPAPREPNPVGEINDLIGHWSFNEGNGHIANDDSGYDNYGVIKGASWIDDGYEGSALQFDGFNDYIDLEHTVGPYLDGASSITVEGWIKLDSLEAKTGMKIFGSRIDGGRAGVELNIRGKLNTIQVAGRSQSSDAYNKHEYSLEQFNFGEWNHIESILDFKNNEIRLLINGVEQTAIPGTTINFGSNKFVRGTTSQHDYIGRGPNETEYFTGMLDDIKIYRTTSKEEEPQPPRESQPEGELNDLVGHWLFNEGSGNNAGDESGYDNYGVIHGASWAPGYEEHALRFNGIDDYVDLEHTVGPYLDGASGVTVASWVKMDSIKPTGMKIFGTRIDGGRAGVELTVRGNQNTIQMSGRSQSADAYNKYEYSLDSFIVGEWNHVVGVMDYKNNDIRLYINGQEQTPSGGAVNFGSDTYIRGTTSEPDSIGRSPNGTEYFNGSLDVISVYRTSLSSEEVLNLFGEQVVDLAEVTLNSERTTINPGETIPLNLAGIMTDGTDANFDDMEIEYLTTNSDIVFINDNGELTLAEGLNDVRSFKVWVNVTFNGNIVTSDSLEITIKATIPLIEQTLEYYYQDAEVLSHPLYVQLKERLKQAQHYYDADRDTQGIKHMSDFIKHLNNEAMDEFIKAEAKVFLNDDAQSIIDNWSN